jgi:hypothetical protein
MLYAEHSYRSWAVEGYNRSVQERDRRAEEALKKLEEARRLAEERRQAEIRKQQEWLLKQATNLQFSDTIRTLVTAIQARPQRDGSEAEVALTKDWVAWATEHADRIDPRLAPIEQVFGSFRTIGPIF